MGTMAKVTSKGQITLPARLRAELGVKPGDVVEFSRTDDGGFKLTAKRERLADLRGSVKLDRKIASSELESWVEDARASRVRTLGR